MKWKYHDPQSFCPEAAHIPVYSDLCAGVNKIKMGKVPVPIKGLMLLSQDSPTSKREKVMLLTRSAKLEIDLPLEGRSRKETTPNDLSTPLEMILHEKPDNCCY
jgi:hypothetical protein